MIEHMTEITAWLVLAPPFLGAVMVLGKALL